jgi:nitroreductase
MNTIKAIKLRRSTRKFKSKKPDWRTIIEAIDSARFAPMAGGFFSLKFILIDEFDKIEKIAKWSEQEFIQDAKYVVAFVSDPKKMKTYQERGEKYMREQAGAAIENFMLHLTDVGLSTCWIGHFNDEKIKQVLKIPEDQELEALFPIGYAFQKTKIVRAKGDMDSCLYFNEWKNNRMKKIKTVE